jgi:hypothetical protein
MAKKQIAMIKELEENVRAVAGEAAADIVMKGAGDLKASTNKAKLAEWVQGAMERLDATVPKDQREKIMAACGRNCAKINHRAIEMFRKRRAKYPSLDDFLNAEAKSPMKGTKLWREKGAVVQAYCPSEYTRPMRCYCALVNGLPADKTMSATYCQCSRAFVQQMWEEALGRPVSVSLLKSAVAGAKECHFQINFRE